jgi:hypothetical protein
MWSYLAIAMLAFGATAADPQPVEWQENYGEALEATRASSEKPLLVVLDEPKEEATRVQPALLEGKADVKEAKLLKHYRLVHIDASTKYGQKVAGAFRAKRFPHMAIIDKSGKVVLFKKSGKISTTEWTSALEQHQDGERVAAKHVSYKLNGDSAASSTPVYSNPSYCPSCQRNRR